MGVTILCGMFFTFNFNDEIFRMIKLVLYNIVMDLNNVMLSPSCPEVDPKILTSLLGGGRCTGERNYHID